MIGLELKSDPKTASKLPLSSKDMPKTSISFASLLHGKTDPKAEHKSVQNGALVLSLSDNTKSDQKSANTKLPTSITALLKGDELQSLQEEVRSLELNPELTKNKTVSELKVIIQEAKQYLKDKITSFEGFKKSEIEALPKTLKGLTQVAKKLGIDVSQITLEELKQSVATKSKESLVSTTAAVTKNKIQTKDLDVEQKVVMKAEQKVQKPVLLFKEQAKPIELTTQQIVSVKVSNDQKTQKQKNENQNTLELLLRGEKQLKTNSSLTTDVSVATAKVIAPVASSQKQESLESLLGGEGFVETPTAKLDGIQTAKTDSLELKINEAKQMIKYLSQDVKQAIEDYKAPFTRVKVRLNPQKLGEIDLTVVQRGKNLHINLSSNNAAINTLAMNANDLKAQLNNSGIQNASLNFSNMSQGDQSGQGSQTHQQQHNRQNAQEEYGYFQQEEQNEEIISSLEIVVPHYA